ALRQHRRGTGPAPLPGPRAPGDALGGAHHRAVADHRGRPRRRDPAHGHRHAAPVGAGPPNPGRAGQPRPGVRGHNGRVRRRRPRVGRRRELDDDPRRLHPAEGGRLMQQVTPTPGGPHNPNSHSEQTILRALKGLDGSRRMTFRFELLDSQDRKLRDLDHAEIDAQGASVSLNNLADAAKRTARFRILDGGPDPIDWLSNRIKPWARLHLPPYGEHDFVEWPLGVFIPVAPSRTTDATGTVWRDVEAYDKLMILDEDLIPARFSTDGILDAYDGFFRDVTGGWGITDSGQPWASTSTPDTTSAVTSAGGGHALIRLDASNNLIRAKVPYHRYRDGEVYTTVSVDQVATAAGGSPMVRRDASDNLLRAKVRYQRYRDGEVYTTVSVDQMATGQAMLPAVMLRLSADLSVYYPLRVHLEIDGSVSLSITRVTTQIGSTVATSVTYTPGAWLHVRARLVGQTIQGKVR